jgi:hypothetical protein
MATGIFSLNRVYKRQFQNVKDKNFTSWPEGAIEGYWGGGLTPPSTVLASIDRLEFSTETVTSVGNLPTTRAAQGTISAPFFGYFGGGAPTVTAITKIDYATNAASLLNAVLPAARGWLAGTSNKGSYGYFAGGAPSPTAPNAGSSNITRLNFSTETVQSLSTPINRNRYKFSAFSSTNFGYFNGGSSDPNLISAIDRIDFATESVKKIAANLSAGADSTVSFASAANGYVNDGYIGFLQRLQFENETLTTLPAVASSASGGRAAVSSFSYGFYAGTPSTIQKFDFSAETAVTSANLLAVRNLAAAVYGGQSVGN